MWAYILLKVLTQTNMDLERDSVFIVIMWFTSLEYSRNTWQPNVINMVMISFIDNQIL